MSYWAHHPLYALGVIYLIILVLRAVLSWFPVGGRGSALARINHWLYVLTEPVVGPFRRIIPPMGMFDVSYMVVVLVVYVLTNYVLARVTI